MADNEETGYGAGSYDDKESNDALRDITGANDRDAATLRDITGQRLNGRELRQLSEIFNTLPEDLQELVDKQTRENDNELDAADPGVGLDSILKEYVADMPPEDRAHIERQLNNMLPEGNSVTLADIAANPESAMENFLDLISDEDRQALVKTAHDLFEIPDLSESEEAEYEPGHEAMAFAAMAKGEEGRRLHVYLAEKGVSSTLVGNGMRKGMESAEERNARILAKQMALDAINNQITLLSQQISDLQLELEEIRNWQDMSDRRNNLLDENDQLTNDRAELVEERDKANEDAERYGEQAKEEEEAAQQAEEEAAKYEDQADELRNYLSETYGLEYRDGQWRDGNGEAADPETLNEMIQDPRFRQWAEAASMQSLNEYNAEQHREQAAEYRRREEEMYARGDELDARIQDIDRKIEENNREIEAIESSPEWQAFQTELNEQGIDPNDRAAVAEYLATREGEISAELTEKIEQRTQLQNERTTLDAQRNIMQTTSDSFSLYAANTKAEANQTLTELDDVINQRESLNQKISELQDEYRQNVDSLNQYNPQPLGPDGIYQPAADDLMGMNAGPSQQDIQLQILRRQGSLSQQIYELRMEEEELRIREEELTSQLTEHEAKLIELEQEYTELNSKLESLEGEESKVDQEITELEAQKVEIDGHLEEVNGMMFDQNQAMIMANGGADLAGMAADDLREQALKAGTIEASGSDRFDIMARYNADGSVQGIYVIDREAEFHDRGALPAIKIDTEGYNPEDYSNLPGFERAAEEGWQGISEQDYEAISAALAANPDAELPDVDRYQQARGAANQAHLIAQGSDPVIMSAVTAAHGTLIEQRAAIDERLAELHEQKTAIADARIETQAALDINLAQQEAIRARMDEIDPDGTQRQIVQSTIESKRAEYGNDYDISQIDWMAEASEPLIVDGLIDPETGLIRDEALLESINRTNAELSAIIAEDLALRDQEATLQNELASQAQEIAELEARINELEEQEQEAAAEVEEAREQETEAVEAAEIAEEEVLWDHVNGRQVYVDDDGNMYWKDEEGARHDYNDGTIGGKIMNWGGQAIHGIRSFFGNDTTANDAETARKEADAAVEMRTAAEERLEDTSEELQQAKIELQNANLAFAQARVESGAAPSIMHRSASASEAEIEAGFSLKNVISEAFSFIGEKSLEVLARDKPDEASPEPAAALNPNSPENDTMRLG